MFLRVFLRNPSTNFGIHHKEVKRKLDYSEKSPQSNLLDSLKRTQKLSSKGQLVKYFVNHVLITS